MKRRCMCCGPCIGRVESSSRSKGGLCKGGIAEALTSWQSKKLASLQAGNRAEKMTRSVQWRDRELERSVRSPWYSRQLARLLVAFFRPPLRGTLLSLSFCSAFLRTGQKRFERPESDSICLVVGLGLPVDFLRPTQKSCTLGVLFYGQKDRVVDPSRPTTRVVGSHQSQSVCSFVAPTTPRAFRKLVSALFAGGHTATNPPDLFRTPKLTVAGPGQYWGGGPPGKPLGCC